MTAPTCGGTIEGNGAAVYGFALNALPPDRHFEIAPKGYRWPWSPIYVGRAVFTTATRTEGDTDVHVDIDFEYTEGPTRERVGLRRWLKRRTKR